MLKVDNLRLGFMAGKQALAAVDGISFAIAQGETFALLGESGCGKSATAQGIMRLLPAAGRILGGRVELDGTNLLARPKMDIQPSPDRLAHQATNGAPGKRVIVVASKIIER